MGSGYVNTLSKRHSVVVLKDKEGLLAAHSVHSRKPKMLLYKKRGAGLISISFDSN